MNRCWTILLTLALTAGGCATYQVGSTLPPDIKSIHIPVFANKTAEPGVDQEATSATIEEFQTDGTLSVTSANQADLILTVVVTKFELKALRYDPERATTSQEFRLTLFADIVAKRTSDGSVWAERKGLEGDSEFEVQTDMRAAKKSALPLAATDLAHKIVESVVEAW